jgi:hypothetical protein
MAAVEAHNDTILATLTNPSSIYLPYRFVLYRHSQTDTTVPTEHKYNAALITTKHVRVTGHPYVWEMDLCESPTELLSEGVLLPRSDNDHWLNGTSHKIVVKRSSRNHAKHGKYYTTEISYAGAYILMGVNGDKIPVMNMTHRGICLSSKFNQLDQPDRERWCVKIQPFTPILSHNLLHRHQLRHERLFRDRDPEPVVELNPPITLIPPRRRPSIVTDNIITPITPIVSMPQHIVNAYIDTLIQRNEACPISMNPLTRETACLTPCGHVASHHEATRWIQDAHSCPVCRSSCSVGNLQMWRQ